MLRRRRWLASSLAVLTCTLAVAGAVVAIARGRERDRAVGRSSGLPSGPPTSSPSQPEPQPPLQPGSDALVGVAVATLWLEPGRARPIDEPSLTNPVDVRRWVSSMTVADKTWLVGRLATQALYGDRVTVLATSGDWTKVVVAGQPSSLDPRGYPGWLPTVQLSPTPAGPPGDRWAVVTVPATTMAGTGLEVSYGTRLPLVAVEAGRVTVATPGGGQGVLEPSDVKLVDPGTPAPSPAEVVESAGQFFGLDYLWGGTTAEGYDCSGLTWALYRAHGIVIPRDALDQAVVGSAVEPADLRAGDLLFYASGPGQDTIHHVAMYAGEGAMIQSAATGRVVETVAVDVTGLSGEYWGARRLLP